MRARMWLTGVGIVLAASFTVYVLHSAWGFWGDLRYVRRQIETGERFMKGLTGEQLDDWIAWADAQMQLAIRDGSRAQWGEKEMPSKLRGLGLLRCDMETNRVVLIWAGGIGGKTDLEFKRMADGRIHAIAWFREDRMEELRRRP